MLEIIPVTESGQGVRSCPYIQKPFLPIPKATEQVAHAAFPKGNLYLTMRDELGTIYTDGDFETLFSLEGQKRDR